MTAMQDASDLWGTNETCRASTKTAHMLADSEAQYILQLFLKMI